MKICLKNALREIYLKKKTFKSLKNQMFPRKWGKTKIWVFTYLFMQKIQ